jgi:Sec-independent protein secretion pathway component TatC
MLPLVLLYELSLLLTRWLGRERGADEEDEEGDDGDETAEQAAPDEPSAD